MMGLLGYAMFRENHYFRAFDGAVFWHTRRAERARQPGMSTANLATHWMIFNVILPLLSVPLVMFICKLNNISKNVFSIIKDGQICMLCILFRNI